MLFQNSDKFIKQKYKKYLDQHNPKSGDPGFLKRMKTDMMKRIIVEKIIENIKDDSKLFDPDQFYGFGGRLRDLSANQ